MNTSVNGVDLVDFYEEINLEIRESSMALVFGSQRLTSAEIFDNFIPGTITGVGKNRRKFRVDGYQMDDADDSIHLAICDFSNSTALETITKTEANNLFKQLQHYVEVCLDRSIWDRETSLVELPELSKHMQNRQEEITRFRFHLFSNRSISKRLELEDIKVGEVKAETLIWDLERMQSLARSRVGSEEFVVDFTQFSDRGLPCLRANDTEEYEGYLAVIDGDTLAGIYDAFGSRVLEGNVRAYLSARGKVNKGIQRTIATDVEKFFAFNNGISCTATEVEIEDTESGCFLKSAKYLQIVNGGQTTASIFIASRASDTGFSPVSNLFCRHHFLLPFG